jgi:hypothetical protein
MTKTETPRPEPTTGTDYDSYLAPRSKTPAKQALYDYLFDQGWRFDTVQTRWHTPEDRTMQASGRLEYSPHLAWATIQPPNQPGSMRREQPIARFSQGADGAWRTEED